MAQFNARNSLFSFEKEIRIGNIRSRLSECHGNAVVAFSGEERRGKPENIGKCNYYIAANGGFLRLKLKGMKQRWINVFK